MTESQTHVRARTFEMFRAMFADAGPEPTIEDFRRSYDSMFTSNFAWTVLQGIVWFGVFTLIFQFHPWHALGLGLVTMVLVSGLATMG